MISTDMNQFRVPVQVLVYCYRKDRGRTEFLLLKRSAKRGGFWQGVSGAPFDGEELIQAAKRELLEETGINPKSIRQTSFMCSLIVEPQWRHHYRPEVTKIDEFVFTAELSEFESPTLSDEHVQFAWHELDACLELLKYPNNKDALRASWDELR